MATHSIGNGTRNLTVNLFADQARIIGRLAYQSGARSVNDFVRHALIKAVEYEHPAEALELRRAESRRRAMAVVLLVAGAMTVAVQFFSELDLRRAPRAGVRIARIARQEGA